MRTPESGSIIQDYEKCSTEADIDRVLAELNRRGWSLICVTPDLDGSFFVFFRRAAYG